MLTIFSNTCCVSWADKTYSVCEYVFFFFFKQTTVHGFIKHRAGWTIQHPDNPFWMRSISKCHSQSKKRFVFVWLAVDIETAHISVPLPLFFFVNSLFEKLVWIVCTISECLQQFSIASSSYLNETRVCLLWSHSFPLLSLENVHFWWGLF